MSKKHLFQVFVELRLMIVLILDENNFKNRLKHNYYGIRPKYFILNLQ
jgi:hypothetical protein